MKSCVLYEDNYCTECGQCNLCDLCETKVCDNCCACLEQDADYKGIEIDEIIIED